MLLSPKGIAAGRANCSRHFRIARVGASAPVSVAVALPVSRSTTCTRPASPSTLHSASLFGEPVRGRGNANLATGTPPTQPRNLPCILRTEIERLRVQPLCSLRRRIVGSDAVESGQRACRRGGAVPSPAPSLLETAKRGHDAGGETRSSSFLRLRNSNHRTLPLGAALPA